MSWDDDKGKAKVLSDSKGKAHYILFQEYKMSCGPASIAMTESQYKLACMIDPEARARQISQKYPGSYTATGGTNGSNLTDVLNAEGVKTYACTQVPTNQIYNYLAHYVKERTSVICHIQWTKGGHFVVARKVYSDGTVVFLDPWYGLVEVKSSNLPMYNPAGAGGSLSGWMNITYL